MKKTILIGTLFICLSVLYAQTSIGDTLTVIQKPLLNIPEIVTPGETFKIECDAPPSTDGWSAEIIHGQTVIPMQLNAANYYTSLGRWVLQCTAPENPPLYEIYDLHVSANGDVDDIEKHAVHLIPAERDSYTFIHITDTHLPTTLYYYEDGADEDSSSVIDLREVINDINIINPEFVLFTGDVVHEGELEDFLEKRYYTRAKRLLAELDVPVFVTSGNHDIGGWDSTPPPDGTSRKNWWKFFGWNRLADPPSGDPYYTQNYSFDYGNVHYMGMEAYDNYDQYMTWIYGYESFTQGQMDWLEEELTGSENATNRVLFYHFDFSDQIDLHDMDVDLALWGHIHYDSGSTHYHPYDLATDNVCNGGRAFRPVHVAGNIVDPQETLYAGYSGTNLRITYTPSNEGVADSVYALVRNGLEQSFANCQLKFVMPSSEHGYNVAGGELFQVDRSDDFNVCYVRFDMPEDQDVIVTIAEDNNIATDPDEPAFPAPVCSEITQVSPNPFNPETRIFYSLSEDSDVRIKIYNARGALVDDINLGRQTAGSHSKSWSATNGKGNRITSGVYLIRLIAGKKESIRKAILLK